MKSQFGWDLPPGVTTRDIDRQAGTDRDERLVCERCGELAVLRKRAAGGFHCVRMDGRVICCMSRAMSTEEAAIAAWEELQKEPYDENE